MPPRCRKPSPDEPLATPFVVVIDSREQAPYAFTGLRADAKDGGRPLCVQTTVAGLRQGDYSLVGFETHIAVERKSKADLFSTLGQGRERFVAELERLTGNCGRAAVVVEASWADVLAGHEHSDLNPKTIHRSVIAWQQRYPSVHWWFMDDRRLAEITTFRILERFWREKQAKE